MKYRVLRANYDKHDRFLGWTEVGRVNSMTEALERFEPVLVGYSPVLECL